MYFVWLCFSDYPINVLSLESDWNFDLGLLTNFLLLIAQPIFIVIESMSPTISPSVVAQIFIIQNERVIAGSLFIV
jgi:hypothetical protein